MGGTDPNMAHTCIPWSSDFCLVLSPFEQNNAIYTLNKNKM